jgi:hypothetical protein
MGATMHSDDEKGRCLQLLVRLIAHYATSNPDSWSRCHPCPLQITKLQTTGKLMYGVMTL